MHRSVKLHGLNVCRIQVTLPHRHCHLLTKEINHMTCGSWYLPEERNHCTSIIFPEWDKIYDTSKIPEKTFV